MAEYTPQQQQAVDAYMAGGGNQAAVDAYFAGNPSNEQFLQDAGAYWGVDAPAPAPAPAPVDPRFDKLKNDVIGSYLAAGGSQADIDAYFAGNPSYEQLATDAATAYMEFHGGDPNAQADINNYFGLPPDPRTIQGPRNIPGTNLRSAGAAGNNWVGGAFSHEDAWDDPVHFRPDGTPIYAPGYGPGAAPGSVVQNVAGGTPAQGTPPIFQIFQDLFAQLQPQLQQFQQKQKQNPNWYAPGFQTGGVNDPMIVQNAIDNQTDPNSMAGLFKNLYDNFNSLQQQQGGSRAIMPALEQGVSFGQQNNPYQIQSPEPVAATTPTATGPKKDPRAQQAMGKIKSLQASGRGF